MIKWNLGVYEMTSYQVSDVRCVTLAVSWLMRTWQCDRGTCHRASPQEMLATYANCWPTCGEKKKKEKKETPKFMRNLQCGDRRSDGDFLRACTFIIQNDIHSIRYGSWCFCLIFMTDTKSRSNITNSGSKSISSSNEVQLQHCKSYLCFTWVFTFYAI